MTWFRNRMKDWERLAASTAKDTVSSIAARMK